MDKFIEHELEELAIAHGLSLHQLKRMVYSDLEEEYDKEDIENYIETRELDEELYSWVDTIREIYRDDYDCSVGYEDNIEMAIEKVERTYLKK